MCRAVLIAILALEHGHESLLLEVAVPLASEAAQLGDFLTRVRYWNFLPIFGIGSFFAPEALERLLKCQPLRCHFSKICISSTFHFCFEFFEPAQFLG